jgi:hypothetical protein
VLGDLSIFIVGKDEYDELACKLNLYLSSILYLFVQGSRFFLILRSF